MKNIKKSAAFLLILLIMLSQILASCAKDNGGNTNITDNDDQSSTDSTEGEEAEAESNKIGFSVSNQKENIPDDADFGGKDFTILVGDPAEQTWTYTNMVVDEETGDTIDDAYYLRNRIVEDRLNINIKQVAVALGSDQSKFKLSVNSGDNSFDMAMIRYNGAANLAVANYCTELNEVPYLDFTKPWWDKGSLKDLSISNRNYMMASDISIGDNDNTWLIYFDKQLVQDLNLGNMYETVTNGEWTFGKMLEMMKVAEHDTDGDGKMTMKDRYGFLTHGENYAGMWIAANQTLIAKDADDMPYIAFGNETFYSVWGKIIEIMNDPSCKANDIAFISTGLANGQTLFGTEILKFVRDYRSNVRDFGILPMPKFDENQEGYHTYVAVSAPLLTIPKGSQDLETTGIIVEAMAAQGHRTIMPAYYEVSIEGKFVRDVESIDMLDIAFSSRKYDLGVVFNWASMSSTLSGTYGPKNNPGISSLLEKSEARINAAIEKTFAAFDAD